MRVRLRDYAELVRIPNVFTAATDVVAGFVYVGGGVDRAWGALLLILTSCSLYCSGMALNDVCDVAEDTRERPKRPIPSGRIPLGCAFVLSAVLLSSGLFLSFFISRLATLIAVVLIALIVLYNVFLKATALGPMTMGACRAANLLLGMSLGGISASAPILVPVILMGTYITSVSYFARQEAVTSDARRLYAGMAGVCASACGLAVLPWLRESPYYGYLPLLAVWVVVLATCGQRAARSRAPRDVQGAVKLFVLSLIVFDGCVAWSAAGIMAGLVIGATIVPTILLARWFRVT